MKSRREELIEAMEKIPNEFLHQAYVITVNIENDQIRISVQGYFDSDIVEKYHKQAKVSSNGFVEFSVDGIQIIMT
jgi:hypothetical protein